MWDIGTPTAFKRRDSQNESVSRVLCLSFAFLASVAFAGGEPTQGKEAAAWTGLVNFNAMYMVNFKDQLTLFADARAEQRLLSGSVLDYGILYAVTRQAKFPAHRWEPTEDRWRLSFRYDGPASEDNYLTLGVIGERNRMTGLGPRLIPSVSAGRVLAISPTVRSTGRLTNPREQRWRGSLGVAYVDEEYLNQAGSNHKLGYQIGSIYEYILPNHMEINYLINYNIAFHNIGDALIFSNFNLLIPVTPRARIALNLIYDHDSVKPPTGRTDNFRYGLNLNYRF